MHSEPTSRSRTGCLTSLVFYRLRRELLEIVPDARARIRPSARLADIIPCRLRRITWQRLRERGFKLPPLGLSPAMWIVTGVSVLGRSTLLAVLFNNAWFMAAIFPFAFIAYWLSRPLAINPPVETVREAVLLATPFRRADYEAGLWPRSDISAKVRMIIADACGVAFEEVREETRIAELCP